MLQELYVRQGITPKYDLVQIEGAVHEPTFKYRVTVGDAVATGTKNVNHDMMLRRIKFNMCQGLQFTTIQPLSIVILSGCGASKKKAKHEAAKNILTKLKAAQKYVNATTCNDNSGSIKNEESSNKINLPTRASAASAVVNVQLPNLETDLMSPYDDGISGNPVGELQVSNLNSVACPFYVTTKCGHKNIFELILEIYSTSKIQFMF